MQDSFQRTIDYLRLSLTDRCQLRCRYCMPAEGIAFTPTEKHLTYFETEQILTAFAKLGVKKLKLTGGEPLLHPELSQIIQFAKKKLHYESVTITTNGVLLKKNYPP